MQSDIKAIGSMHIDMKKKEGDRASSFFWERLAELSQMDLLLLQLPTSCIDIVSTGIADRGLNAVHSKSALQQLDLMHGGRLK